MSIYIRNQFSIKPTFMKVTLVLSLIGRSSTSITATTTTTSRGIIRSKVNAAIGYNNNSKRLTTSSNNNNKMTRIWKPRKFLELIDSTSKYAVVILNRPIFLDPKHTIKLWNDANIRVCVDGGANRWIQFLNQHCTNGIKMKVPELITGDFDSITENSINYMKSIGSVINETTDQNETDFTKSLMILKPYIMKDNIDSVIVLLDMSGRIDHIMAHINTLCKANQFLSDTDIYILCKQSISWLLPPGSHVIHIPKLYVENEYWCSHVPISGTNCMVTTTGLKWDLEDHPVEFGGMVSTSNSYSKDIVTIKTNGFLYWSMGIVKDHDD